MNNVLSRKATRGETELLLDENLEIIKNTESILSKETLVEVINPYIYKYEREYCCGAKNINNVQGLHTYKETVYKNAKGQVIDTIDERNPYNAESVKALIDFLAYKKINPSNTLSYALHSDNFYASLGYARKCQYGYSSVDNSSYFWNDDGMYNFTIGDKITKYHMGYLPMDKDELYDLVIANYISLDKAYTRYLPCNQGIYFDIAQGMFTGKILTEKEKPDIYITSEWFYLPEYMIYTGRGEYTIEDYEDLLYAAEVAYIFDLFGLQYK